MQLFIPKLFIFSIVYYFLKALSIAYNKIKHYLNNKLNVINYQAIEHFDNNKIMIKVDKLLVIEGKNLVVTKLLEDEIQIEGSIKKIEFR